MPIENDLFDGGFLSCTLPLGAGEKSLPKIVLEIIATDAVGNVTTKFIELTNAEIANINRIEVQCNNTPIDGGRITLRPGQTAQLRVMGYAPGSAYGIDLTGSDALSLQIFGGSSALLSGNTITAGTDGQTLVSASFDLGGGRMLLDGVVIMVGDSSQDDDDIEAAKAAIERAAYTAAQADVGTVEDARAVVRAIIGGLALNGVTATVADCAFAQAVAGSEEKSDGVNGRYGFVVRLNKGVGVEQSTAELVLIITATPFNSGDGFSFELVRDGGRIYASANAGSDGVGAILYLACYDSGMRMIAVKSGVADAGGRLYVEMLSLPDDAVSVKAFLWDRETFVPLVADRVLLI
jgi:hypothetical protein